MRTEEIAQVLGWSTQRTARWLDGLARRDPSVVVRVNGRRTTTLATLRRVVPDIAKKFASDADLENVRAEQVEQKSEIDNLAKELRDFRRKSHDWFSGIYARMNAVEKKLRQAG